MKRLILITFFTLVGCSNQLYHYSPLSQTLECENLKPLILMIGDGMGPEQVMASSYYNTGVKDGFIVFDKKEFPEHAMVSTHALDNPITDSAAAGTAMATGHKADRGELSIDPNDRPLKTILEEYKRCGFATGLVTTSYLLDATPAAFGSHVKSRGDRKKILKQFLNKSRPNLLLGGGRDIKKEKVRTAGYSLITNKAELEKLSKPYPEYVAGIFTKKTMSFEIDKKEGEPRLIDMAKFSVDYMLAQSKPFFLMIEGGRIDHAGHANDLIRNITETKMFMDTVSLVSAKVKSLRRYTIIVTADHETGGLKLKETPPRLNELPNAQFFTQHHTSKEVHAWMRTTEGFKLRERVKNVEIIPYFKSKLDERSSTK